MTLGMVATGAAPASGASHRAAAAVGRAQPWPTNPDWQRYVEAPSSRHVTPVAVVSATSNVSNPQALLHPGSGETTTLTRTLVGLDDPGPDGWPVGSVATASSYYPGISPSGHTYVPSNALGEGGLGAYWNNATAGSTHSWLEVTTPSPVTLSSVTLDFDANGVPVDFYVQTWDATTAAWVNQFTVTNNSSITFAGKFPAPVETEHLRIFITLDQNIGHGQYSRIAGVFPYYSPPTHLILDYGKDVGGVPKFDVVAESGSPQLEAGYSESAQYLTPIGDMGQGGPFGSGDPHRYDIYTVDRPGVIVNRFVQGGERYEELSLLSPGSVTLSGVWIHYEPYLGTLSTFAGRFVSSSNELNTIWYDGAYTANLVQMRPNTPAGYWAIQNGVLNADGGGTGLLKTGSSWTDYSLSLQTEILSDQSGWVVRAQAPDTKYLVILDDSTDAVGEPNALQELVQHDGAYTEIADVPLDFTVTPDTWYDVRIVVSGTTVTTFIDGSQVASFDSSSFPAGVAGLSSGTIGLREYSDGEDANFRDLSVTAPDGTVLFSSPLDATSDLSAFDAPGVNQIPVVLDGAKRDRAVWEGDLSVSGPTIYYSNDAARYLRDSLELLGSYQLTSGFVPGVEKPGTPVHVGPAIPGEVTSYSASYSMYWVVNLATYDLYTGDTAFVEQEWPRVQAELAWNAAQLNSQGLFVTNGSDGANWHYTDLTGAQTYYNELYYRTLLSAAQLATAAGHPRAAASYDTQATALRMAINTYLFDPATGSYNESTTVTGVVPQDADAYAILYGIAPKSRIPGIVEAMESALSTPAGALDISNPAPAGYGQLIGPFMGSYEVWALLASHHTAQAIQLMRTEWGRMTVPGPDYTGAIWEVEGTNGSITSGVTSLAHGWSTGPTSALSEYVLGIAPTSPGYSTWEVEPHPGSLAWVEGQAPTPHGAIAVDWGHEATEGRFVMKVTIPTTTTGVVGVPTFGRQAVIHVNGRLVWNNGVFHAAPGITGAHLGAHDVVLDVSPAALAGGSAGTATLLVNAKATGT
jgi:alpha-L-rhamnosidase